MAGQVRKRNCFTVEEFNQISELNPESGRYFDGFIQETEDSRLCVICEYKTLDLSNMRRHINLHFQHAITDSSMSFL